MRNIVMQLLPVFYLLVVGVSLCSCSNDNEIEPLLVIQFKFLHLVDNEPVVLDELEYLNEAGNAYEVTEVQWFISDVVLFTSEGEVEIQKDNNIHYIDTNLSETMTWVVEPISHSDRIDKIQFVFGLCKEKNTVGMFTELPEINMLWPYHMGGDYGGYHYMKLNGFWVDPANLRQPFNFHLGVGKVEDSGDGSASYIQNWFAADLPVGWQVASGQDTVKIPIIMNIENWFKNPHTWDHDLMGPKIMKNQAAMRMGIENGQADVFTIGDMVAENYNPLAN